MVHKWLHKLQTSKSSGFRPYNIIIHWGHNGKDVQKKNVEFKNQTGLIVAPPKRMQGIS